MHFKFVRDGAAKKKIELNLGRHGKEDSEINVERDSDKGGKVAFRI